MSSLIIPSWQCFGSDAAMLPHKLRVQGPASSHNFLSAANGGDAADPLNEVLELMDAFCDLIVDKIVSGNSPAHPTTAGPRSTAEGRLVRLGGWTLMVWHHGRMDWLQRAEQSREWQVKTWRRRASDTILAVARRGVTMMDAAAEVDVEVGGLHVMGLWHR